MDILILVELLLLLGVANGTPVALKNLCKDRFDAPVDFGVNFFDGYPLLGKSKTWRGVICAVFFTGISAALIGWEFLTGLLFGAASMVGDLVSSFIKRRLRLPSSSMALGLDQIPEAGFPLLVVYTQFALSIPQVLMVLLIFFVGELLISRLLFVLHLRDRPY